MMKNMKTGDSMKVSKVASKLKADGFAKMSAATTKAKLASVSKDQPPFKNAKAWQTSIECEAGRFLDSGPEAQSRCDQDEKYDEGLLHCR